MSGKNRSVLASAARLGLGAAEPAYRAAIAARNRMFDLGLRLPTRLPGVTVSVGNLTTGGTGKTPMVAELARRLLKMGHRPAILSRGYGGADEAAELEQALNGSEHSDDSNRVPIVADPDRSDSARRALALLSAGKRAVFLLDDAFQHRQVARDLDLVLIDATQPFGYDHVLPRGLLREPVHNLRRADAVIVTRANHAEPEMLEELDNRIADLSGAPPIAHVAHRWLDTQALHEQSVVGACGIANPAAFFSMLERHAGRVLACKVFADHHAYTRDEVHDLIRRAVADGASTLVTTEKDWVKWSALGVGAEEPELPIVRPRLSLEFLHGGDAVDALLRKIVNSGAA